MHPLTIITIIFFVVTTHYMQTCARISDGSECSDNCLHGKRSNEESKAIHFIRSHLGIMRFGKRSAAQFGTISFDKRIDLDRIIHQNDENSNTDSSNDYSISYGKTPSFDLN